MERFSAEPTLTTSEVADLLEVHPSSVKRWSNDGELPFDKTSGGHRRIHLEDALDFASRRGIRTVLTPFHPYEPHAYNALRRAEESGDFTAVHTLSMGWLHRGKLQRIRDLYDALARRPGISFCQFCDQGIRGFMGQIGMAWREGRIRAGEEHMVSQVMVEVLLKLRADLRQEADEAGVERTKVAVVGSLEGNQHHLGSLCIRLLLERKGWEVCYLGPDVPIEDFGVIQRGRRAELVCISLPAPAAAGDVHRALGVLSEFYDVSLPYALALGGSVPDQIDPALLIGPFRNVGIFSACDEFSDRLNAGWARGALAGATL